jgi:hypothetical protein
MKHVRAAVRYDDSRLAVTIRRGPFADNLVRALLNVDELHPLTTKATAPDLFELLDLCVGFYALDRSVKRSPTSWVRHFEIEHPVADVAKWTQHAPLLREWFSALTDDIVEVLPIPLQQNARPLHHERQANLNLDDGVDVVGLLSDGLDSLCGLDAALRRPARLAVASVITNPLRGSRIRRVIDGLAGHGRHYAHHVVKTNLNQERKVREKSQRSRTVLAVVTGMTVAQALGAMAVESYENGIGVMNLPVPDLQYGAMSSQVLNPVHLPLWDRVSRAFFGRTIEVRYPNLHATKSQMVAGLSMVARRCVPLTSSCDGAQRQGGRGVTDCGTCSSCRFRQLAIVCSGVPITDVAYAGLRTGNGPNAMRVLTYHGELLQEALRQPDQWTALVHLHPELADLPAAQDGRLRALSYAALNEHHQRTRALTIDILKRHVAELASWGVGRVA